MICSSEGPLMVVRLGLDVCDIMRLWRDGRGRIGAKDATSKPAEGERKLSSVKRHVASTVAEGCCRRNESSAAT